MSTNIKIIIQIKNQNIALTLEEGESLFNELKKIFGNNQKPIIREPVRIPSILPKPEWPESQPLTYKIKEQDPYLEL